MPIPGQDAGGVTPEPKLRLKFYCSWTWWFLLLLLFVCYINVDVLFLFLFPFSCFLSVLSTSLSLSSPPYSHSLHSLSCSCATILCSPSHLLFLPLSIHYLTPPSPPFTVLPQAVTTLSLPPTHSLPDDQPTVPLYTTPTPCNPWHNYPTLQQQKYTQTHIRATKPSSPHITSPTHPPHFPLPHLVPP
jgi:hypothetical protein